MGLLSDARSIVERDPAARNSLEVILLYSGFHAVMYYRVAHFFHKIHLKMIARLISQFGRFMTGVEIHPGAKIGKALFIDHGMGIVIGETAEIGDNCTIYHNVTLGGTGKDTGKRHPTLGDNVLVATGAKILGPFKVGDNARIGANAVVLSEVEPDSTVIGVPGRVVKRKGERVSPAYDLDQVHMPDPVSQEFCRLQVHIRKMEEAMQKAGIEMPAMPQADSDDPEYFI